MPTIDLNINGNKHAISCNDGEELRLKSLADKFNKKLEQIAPAFNQTDDKTLYLITALILLDETEESQPINTTQSSTNDSELIKTIYDKVFSIKKLLQT